MIAPCSQADDADTQQITLETPRLILRAAQPSDAIPLHEAFKDAEVMRYWSTPPHSNLETTSKWITSMIESPQNGITDFIITLKQPLPTSTSTSTPTPSSDTTTTTSTSASDTPIQPLPIGKIGIYRPPPSNEIGFLISRNHWGQGLAKEAQRCMLGYLFSIERAVVAGSDSDAHSQPDTQQQTQNSQATPESYTTLSVTDQKSPWLYPSISADIDPRNEASKAILSRMGFIEIGFVERTDCIGGEWVDSVYYRLRRERWPEIKER